jgi:general secretion pathway protein I
MRNQSRGMTLIEVLVAFVVLSVTLAVILQIFTGGMRNARLADGYSRAVFLAESKLAAAGVERPLMAGDDVGQMVDMQWQVNVLPVDDGGAADRLLLPSRLYQVRVRVEWHEDGRARQVVLDSMRLGPRQ